MKTKIKKLLLNMVLVLITLDAPLPQAGPGRVGHGGQVGGQLSGGLNLSAGFSFNPLEILVVGDTWRRRVEGRTHTRVAM